MDLIIRAKQGEGKTRLTNMAVNAVLQCSDKVVEYHIGRICPSSIQKTCEFVRYEYILGKRAFVFSNPDVESANFYLSTLSALREDHKMFDCNFIFHVQN